jgi:hypothetical protein
VFIKNPSKKTLADYLMGKDHWLTEDQAMKYVNKHYNKVKELWERDKGRKS